MGIYPTREQFLSKLRWANAIAPPFAFASMGLVCGAFVAGLSYVQKHPEIDADTIIPTVVAPFIVGYAVVLVVVLMVIFRAFGPNCPKCRRWFWRRSATVVLANGRCGYCGTLV